MKKFLVFMSVVMLLSQALLSYAGPGGGGPGGPGGGGPAPHGGPGGGRGPGGGPHGGGPHGGGFPYVPVIVGGLSFLYAAGVFYQSTADGYAIVAAPPGAVISALPVGYTTVVAGGATYYYYNYTYYAPTAGGYVVVANPTVAAPVVAAPAVTAAPVVVQQPAPVVIQQQPSVVVQQPAPVVIQQPAPVVVKKEKHPDSQNPIKKLGRGIFCAVFGVFEIPMCMADISNKEGPAQGVSYGFLKGVGVFILREVVACVEVGTFILPLPGTIESPDGERSFGYGPLMLPEWVFPGL